VQWGENGWVENILLTDIVYEKLKKQKLI